MSALTNLIFLLILLRWFSPLQRFIWSDKNEPPGNDKQWKRLSFAEMVDDLFSENPTTRAWALRKTRQLMMDFPDRLMFNVIRINKPPKLVDDMSSYEQAYLPGKSDGKHSGRFEVTGTEEQLNGDCKCEQTDARQTQIPNTRLPD
ncbi:unnamed protein product [Calicophoron daubneyi]|uniref:Uncharacterized protein n=1 Tax=Calicophoron daubneyi TaxID=300641 RepID=A0AAV2TZW5_CALDB